MSFHDKLKPPRKRSGRSSAKPEIASAERKEKRASAKEPASEFAGPVAVISRRAADRLRAGHVWVYQSDVESVLPPEAASPLVTIADKRGIPLGTALYSATSQISLRLVCTAQLSDEQWLSLVRERLRAAVKLRKRLLAGEDSDACRLVFSEADQLPGLIADRYGEMLVLQILSRGMDRREIREAVVEVLRDEIDPAIILERSDPRIRELEQMEAPPSAPLYSRTETPQLTTVFRLNRLGFHYDANAGQKTGAFLDQRENYAAAARHAHGEALDVCCYQGGFALHLARSCRRVTGVDISRAALEVAERNLELNRAALHGSEVDWIEANAFDLLKDWSGSGTAFDTIVLDPPAFAKTKRAAEGALRGYKELNLRALKMLRPGGVLVTCSCSHHVSLADFTGIVVAAAGDAHRRVTLIERRGAAADHPVVLTIPETEYLKCLICRVE